MPPKIRVTQTNILIKQIKLKISLTLVIIILFNYNSIISIAFFLNYSIQEKQLIY